MEAEDLNVAIDRAYTDLGLAFEKNTFKLLASRNARAYMAIFRVAFADATDGADQETLYSTIESCEHMLADAGLDIADNVLADAKGNPKSGREVTRTMIDACGWLRSEIDDPVLGTYRFYLTADAMRALDIVDELARTQTTATGTTVSQFLKVIRDLAADVSGNRSERRRILKQRLEEAQAAYDAFNRHEEADLTERETTERIDYAVRQLSSVSADLESLRSAYHKESEDIFTRFLSSNCAGEAMSQYYDAIDSLITETDEGRAFMDIIGILSQGSKDNGNEATNLIRIISRGSRTAHVPARQVARLKLVWNSVTAHIASVNSQRNASCKHIGSLIRDFGDTRARHFSDMLGTCILDYETWAADHDECDDPVLAMPAELCQTALPTPYVERRPSTPLAPIDSCNDDASTLDSETLRRYGAPKTARVMQAMREHAVTRRDGTIDGAATFGRLDASERRLAEVEGLACDERSGIDDSFPSVWHTVGPDGRHADWAGPNILIGGTDD